MQRMTKGNLSEEAAPGAPVGSVHCPEERRKHGIPWKFENGIKVGEPWLVVDDPASTQFSLQSSVLQMQAKTVCVEKEGEFKGRLSLADAQCLNAYPSVLSSAFFASNLFFQRTTSHLKKSGNDS